MELLGHILFLVLIFAGIWLCAGVIVRAVDALARRLHRSGFAVAFLVLGLLTSITEVSVAVNSTLAGTPHLSVGNLVGGSLVIFLLIIPLLAFLGGGVQLRHALTRRTLLAALVVIALPSLVVMRGVLTPAGGVLLIGAYGLLLFLVARQELSAPLFQTRQTKAAVGTSLLLDIMKILGAGVVIFFIGRLLVDEAVAVAGGLHVPTSLIGLLVLSVGTNTPEIMIAIRAVTTGKKEVALGDYIGSAATNTLILGLLALVNGRFTLDATEFVITAPVAFLGLGLFYRFSRSQDTLSPREGVLLGGLGILFVLAQVLVTVLLR